ncbi:PDGF/VEGF domain [Popillia japonica]|uniref:PDGF/VEGF domain n=1 Tax=Popillia japonica TaxID=7064 RepID=A0AAW1LT44_POPJA
MCTLLKIALCSVVFSIFFALNESTDKKRPAAASDRLVYPGEVEYASGVELGSNFHSNHPYDEDYDDELERKPVKLKTPEVSSNASLIPINLIKEINSKDYSVNDLLLHYVDDYQEDFLQSRFGEEKAGVMLAIEAKCKPELRTVSLIEKKDPTILYIPSCTRIERCGGCCNHDLLECQPTETETVNFQIYRSSYKGGNNFKYDGKELIAMEKHKSCKCDCKVKETDCSPMQVYEKEKCRCSCRNTDEEKKCAKENSTKLWNPNTCICQCRQELMCTTGSIFDWRQCKCVIQQVRRRNAEQRNINDHRVLSVLPLSRDNYN